VGFLLQCPHAIVRILKKEKGERKKNTLGGAESCYALEQ